MYGAGGLSEPPKTDSIPYDAVAGIVNFRERCKSAVYSVVGEAGGDRMLFVLDQKQSHSRFAVRLHVQFPSSGEHVRNERQPRNLILIVEDSEDTKPC